MRNNECKRNIFLYRLHILFAEPLFWGPILILSLQKLGQMSLPQIYFMESVVFCISILLDIPAGALADLIGRKTTIILGRIFLFVSFVLFVFMENPFHAWLGNILWAIGFSLQSGADTAFFYDTLCECKREDDYKTLEGKFIGFRLLLIAFASIFAGVFADINLRLPLYLCVPFMGIPLITSFFLKEPEKKKGYSAKEQFSILRSGILFVIHSRQVRWMVGFSAFLAVTAHVWFFAYNPYFELVNLPITQYGYIFFGINIAAWIFSHGVQKIENKIGERWCVLGMILALAIPILLMSIFAILPFAYLVLISGTVYGFRRPFVSGYVNRHLSKEIRATVLSVQSSTVNILSIFSLFCFGLCIKNLQLQNALLLLGMIVVLIGGMSYRVYRKTNPQGNSNASL